MQQRILFVVAALVLAAVTGVGSFFYGTSVGEARANQVRQAFFRDRSGNDMASHDMASAQPGVGGPSNQGGTVGQVKSVNGQTIEVSTRDNVTRVTVDDKTQVTKSCAGTLDDIKPGQRIFVQGDTAGGTVTARSIQLVAERGQP